MLDSIRMNDAYEGQTAESLELSVAIIVAYVGRNPVQISDLPSLIREVHQVIQQLQAGPVAVVELVPAVPVRKSLTDDHIVCLEDGKKFKSLKRHLRSKYNMTPEAYREKWGLAEDYPMVAPSYARKRSMLAKDMGLGKVSK